MIDKNQIVIPTWLITGLDKEARERVESGYKDAAWLLRRIRAHYEKELEALYKASDDLHTYEEYLYSAAKRKALRELLRAFPGEVNKTT